MLEKFANEARIANEKNEEIKRKYISVIDDLKVQLNCKNPDAYIVELICEEIPPIVLERTIAKLNIRIWEEKHNYDKHNTSCASDEPLSPA